MNTRLGIALFAVGTGAVVVGGLLLRPPAPGSVRETSGEGFAERPVAAVPSSAASGGSVRSPTVRRGGVMRDADTAPSAARSAESRERDTGRRRGGFRRLSLGAAPMSPEDWAKRWTDRQSRRRAWMTRFDTDGDGQISESEREAMRAEMIARREEFMLRRMTDRFDADGDGVLNDDERAEAEAELAVRRAERRARILERFDTDGDGTISDQERQSMRGRFGVRDVGPEAVARYDANGDGELDLDESYDAYLDRFRAMQARVFVRRYDTGGDGAVDTGDFEAFLTQFRAEEPGADINEDGVIDQRDVERFRDLMTAASP
ncbi:MAG TPA: hypothetical protein ENK11_08810 [Phycisphaerales bacterium]|nr:hypothetical protein [Phycisphaerales bacterium]